MNRILVTGATGKVGQAFISRILNNPVYENFIVRAFCHQRIPEHQERLEVFTGSIDKTEDVQAALEDVTHVLHLATSKESPDTIMDVAIKGLFWLLEGCRKSRSFKQFILIGADAAVGHFFYPHPEPVVESQKHTAYPGCYALSKVLEEVMLEQYYVQYNLNGCCLRAPWIMEKDDFRYQLSFGEDVFGGPVWQDLVGAEKAAEYVDSHAVPVMLDPDGVPVKRNFVHVDDLVNAILLAINHPKANQQSFNICMTEPVDYGVLGKYLEQTRNLPNIPIKTDFYSTWLDNSKARFLLEWCPEYDLKKMTESAWEYERTEDEPRIIHYPG